MIFKSYLIIIYNLQQYNNNYKIIIVNNKQFIGVTLQRRFEIFFLPQSLMFYIMYYWSQTNRNSNVTFMFGFQFKVIFFLNIYLISK